MAFPTVESVTTTLSNSATNSHTINLPATITAGDLLVLFCRVAGSITSGPTDWTTLLSHSVSPIYIFKAVGTEGGGTVTIGTSSSSTAAAKVVRITGWIGDLGEVYRGTQATGSSDSPNPPSATTGKGTEDNLFIAAMVSANFGASVISYPTNYTDGEFSINTSSVFNGVGVAFRELTAENDDPGVFTMGGSVNWAANTVIVRPGAASTALTVPLLSVSPTLHAPTLSASYTLVAPHLSSSLSLLAPTITQPAAGQTLEVPLFSNAPSLFSPGFVYAQSIEGPFHSIAPTLFAPTIVNAAALGVPLLNVAPTLHAPTLDPEVILFVPHLASTLSLFAPSLSPNLTPPVLSVAPSLHAPTLFAQYTLELPVINVSPSLFSPVILGPSFPNVESVTPTTTSGVTSHQINMPATVDEGDLLIMLVNSSSPSINSSPAGWAICFSDARTPVYVKRAAGTEGGSTATVGTSSSSNMAAQVYRITGWRDSGTILNDVEIASLWSANAGGNSSTPDPPSLNPTNWGLEDTLWIAAAGWIASVTLSSYPTNYIDGVTTSVSGASMATAQRNLAASSENPGVFTLGSSSEWRAHTIAVRPAIAPKLLVVPRLELAPNLLPPSLFLDTTQQIVAPLLSLTTTFYPPTLRRIWELVTPNSGTPFSLVTPSSGTDFTLVG